MVPMGEIIGRIFPILPKHLERIFAGKNVFCKFVGKGRPRLSPEMKILFYSSRGTYEVVGEATIDSLEYLSPQEVMQKYGSRLFISAEELDGYTRKRSRPPNKELMVAVLKQIRRYKKPYKLKKPVTMAGLSLTDKVYREIVSQAGL